MQKKRIIHFIFSLGRGGAETMLVQVLKELKEYNNIVVTLFEDNHFENELKCSEYICLNQRSLLGLPASILKFRQLVKKYNPDLVHSHLVLPNFVARLGTPGRIPLISTIHNSISLDFDYKKWFIRCLDRFTYHSRKSVIIAVSKVAMKDYVTFLKVKPKNIYLLYTFVNEKIFTQKNLIKEDDKTFKIISVGALRSQKNYEFLIKAFSKLKDSNIELHIYGDGPLENELKKLIGESNARIILKGEVKNINELLPLYDLYAAASFFEGFSLAILEAMAMKLPLLLTNIGSFKEQCEDTAIYFELNNEDDFIVKLNDLIIDSEKRNLIAGNAQKRVLEKFTLSRHISGLKKIYEKAFA